MDTQFKQRLTGAVILVLLAVLLVPELLTGPKPPASGPSPASLGSARDDAAPPLRSYDIDISESRDSPAPASASPGSAAPMLPAAAAPAPAVPGPPPGPAATRTPPAGNAAPSAALPALRTDADKEAPAPVLRGFAVQVGSFAARVSADRLAADLRRRRFAAFVAPVRSGGRQLFRVRVGPVADRAAGQALLAQLKAIGQDGSIVPLP